MSGTITDQELFDKIVSHAVTMTSKAYDTVQDSCVYRSKDGNRCLVGSLITDEVYAEFVEPDGSNGLEGQNATQFDVVKAVSKSLGVTLTQDQKWMLAAVQPMHDGNFARMEDELKGYANTKGLQYKG